MIYKKLKIIIVDDCEQFRSGLKFYLENKCGFKVIAEASNGNEFLKLCNIHNADIVIMDLMMPEKNGFDTTLEATHLYRGIKIIAITENEKNAHLLQIIQSGFRACILKTEIFDELLNIIEKVMNGEYKLCKGVKTTIEMN